MPLAARVLRDGVEHRVTVRELVPGDVIVLRHGDRVPADARIVADRRLRLDYSILTGESELIRRSADGEATVALADAGNCVLAGTTVMEGSAEALVFATGAATTFGGVAVLMEQLRMEASPLQRELGATATDARNAIVTGLIASARARSLNACPTGLAHLAWASSALIPEGCCLSLSLAMECSTWPGVTPSLSASR
jgi:magnesium-transporting ATPase (P-type)